VVRRRHNVRRTWIVAGATVVAIVVAGVTYSVVRRRSKPRLEPSRYVGERGYEWPHRDLFVDESGFGEAFETFGYDAGDWNSEAWTVSSEPSMAVIREFQEDWNSVSPTLDVSIGPLAVTGRIDDATVEAMAFVHTMQQAGHSWPVLVFEAKEQG